MTPDDDAPPGRRPATARANDEALEQLLRRRRAGPRAVRADRAGPLLLSPLQHGLWFESQLDPDSRLANMRFTIPLPSPLHEDAVVQSVRTIVLRHEILRSVFRSVEGIPVQVVLPASPFTLDRLDLRGVGIEGRRARSAEFGNRRYDVELGPLFRAALVRLDDHALMWLGAHHLVFDGASFGIFVRELEVLYPAFAAGKSPSLDELPLQYADCAATQRMRLEAGRAVQTTFWQRLLAGAIATRLPPDEGRAATSGRDGAMFRFTIDRDLGERIDRFVGGTKSTLFTTLFAAFNALLARWTNQSDLLVSVPMNNRSIPGSRLLIGTFVNLIPLRTRVPDEITFAQLVSQVRAGVLDAFGHADLPLASLAHGAQRSTTKRTLPRILFSHDPPSGAETALGRREQPTAGSSTTADVRGKGGESAPFVPGFELALRLNGGARTGLSGCIDYDAGLFSRSTIERLAESFVILLAAGVTQPEQRIADLPVSERGGDGQLELVDRQERPAADEDLHVRAAYVAPRDPEEETLAGLWRALLGVERVGIDDDFFAAGGHSLLAIRLLAQVERARGVRVPLRPFFANPTVRGLTAEVLALREQRPVATERPVLGPSGTRRARLLAPQRGTYLLDRTAPANLLNRLSRSTLLDGRIDVDALERALLAMRARHPMLRTRFFEDGGELWQETLDVLDLPVLEHVDLSSSPPADQPGADEAAHAPVLQRPFDLARGETARVLLVTLSPTRHRLSVVLHRMISDPVSLQIFDEELHLLWEAFATDPDRATSALRPATVQYLDLADYLARLEQSDVGERQRAYWLTRLAGAPPLALPTDLSSTAVDERRAALGPYTTFRAGSTDDHPLGHGLTAAIERVAREQTTSVMSVLLATLARHLTELTGQQDLCIVSHLQYRHLPGLERTIGLFANPLVMRLSTTGAPTFRELVTRTHDTVMSAFDHGEFDVLGVAPHLFRLFFNYVREPDAAPSPASRGGLHRTVAPVPGPRDRALAYDVMLSLSHKPTGIHLRLLYNLELFHEDGAARLLRGYVACLERGCAR